MGGGGGGSRLSLRLSSSRAWELTLIFHARRASCCSSNPQWAEVGQLGKAHVKKGKLFSPARRGEARQRAQNESTFGAICLGLSSPTSRRLPCVLFLLAYGIVGAPLSPGDARHPPRLPRQELKCMTVTGNVLRGRKMKAKLGSLISGASVCSLSSHSCRYPCRAALLPLLYACV